MENRKRSACEKANVIRIMDGAFYVAIAAVFVIILVYGKPVFAINDDLGLYNVLSGAFTGTPDAHISFMEYPLSWALAALYKVWASVPWYGIFLEGVLFLCIVAGYHRCTMLLHKKECNLLLAVGIRVLFCASWFGMMLVPMLRLQYTVVAGVCGATALFLFITSEDRESFGGVVKQNIGTVLLALLAESIRPEMLLMLLGFAGMLWLGRLGYRMIVTKRYLLYLKRYCAVLGIFVIGLGAVLLCSQLAYRSPEWQNFREIDRYRVKLFDYYGYPSYDENEEYFIARGIDQASYEAVAGLHMYVGRELSAEQWSAMVAIAEDIYQTKHPLAERLSKVFPLWGTWLKDDSIKPVNQIVILWYIVCLCLVLAAGNREGGLLLACVFAARMLCWTALVYRGRYPDRIVMSLFWMEFASLSGVLMRIFAAGQKARKLYISGGICAVLVLILGYFGTEELYRISHAYDDAQKTTWDSLKEYCQEHEEQLFVWTAGSNTLYYFYDTPFEQGLNQYENYIPMSSGHMMNPNTTQKLAQWGIDDLMDAIVSDERLYLIFQEGKLDGPNSLAAYYEQRYDTFYYEQVDTFEAGNVVYIVYRFRIG